MFIKSVLTESNQNSTDLPEIEAKIYSIVREYWPSSALEIADHLGEDINTREKQKRVSGRYTYYLKKLVDKGLLMSKPAGNALIVWPLVVEKYRAIHQILKED